MGPSLEAAMVEAAAQMPSGGDGFAFVFRSIPSSIRAGEIDPTFGRGGSGLGYADLKGLGIVVEFDTKMDLQERDPNANHVSVHVQTPVDGESFTSYENDDARVVPLTYATLPLRRPRILSSRRKRVVVTSTPLVVQISYTPSLHLLKVFLNDLVSPILVVKDAPVISGEFQVGFTGSQSGESRDTQEICQWYFEKQEVSVAAMKGIRAAGVGAMKDSNSAAASSSHPTNAALASSPSSSSPPTTLPSSKPTAHESCDSGFTGESCTLDLTHLASECLTATSGGCSGCLAHPSGHCQWCASQARCISNELTTRSFDTLAVSITTLFHSLCLASTLRLCPLQERWLLLCRLASTVFQL
jgi:hypothetical protein